MTSPNDIDVLISARWILPITVMNEILLDHCVAIKNQRIIDILPQQEAQKKYHAKENVQLKDHVLMPGLVNAHTHTPMNLFRGLADDLKLMDWLNNHIWPAEGDIINADSIRDGCRLAIAEMIRGGTTCFNEMYFFPNETANTAIEEGMRACIGHTIMNVPTGWAQTDEEYFQKAIKAYETRPKNPLITWTIAPHAPYTNSDSSLKRAKELADSWNFQMNIHLHETEDEIQMEIQKSGKTPIKRLHDIGLLTPKLIAIHMVHLSDEDIQLIKEGGCHVVHCPESNLKLASGFSPTKKLIEQGVNVAIGTDGAASNNDLDMFSELRTASLIAKAVNGDSTAFPAGKVLEMATLGGAKALGLEKEIGSLEKGKYADLIAVNLNSILTQPIYSPISHLAYAVNRLQVSDVWIAGKRLLKNGEFTTLDVEKTIAKANEWAHKAAKYEFVPVSRGKN